jgi:hypothetical protein
LRVLDRVRGPVVQPARPEAKWPRVGLLTKISVHDQIRSARAALDQACLRQRNAGKLVALLNDYIHKGLLTL